ncbi:MAG TPA: GC-type dockerin domain-anchored protein [Phycisphaerales bacterium]|nr:GC-type dockerin domain-anchored protein [Phycisphaerales bacterium]
MTRQATNALHGLAAVLLACAGSAASAQEDGGAILQWFENQWQWIEHRAPDFFHAGYGALWLPPPSKCADPKSPGYDVFDRFDLGAPGAPTAYGTEQGFRAAIGELHQADGLVYVDLIMNHNSGRQASVGFQQAGGYPGFWLHPEDPARDKRPTDDWGDFHGGNAGGYLQSENPNGPNYDRLRGDLVALIDIGQETNHQFIRHPVAEGDPRNIPAGTAYNRVSPANARCYTDQSLAPKVVRNPGTTRNPPPGDHWEFSFHPYNTLDPMAGDAVTDNTTGLLMRFTQWLLDDFGVDGYRLDAAKHVPSWFWDTYWDSVLFERRTTPAGTPVTPISFVECVDGNSFAYAEYVRKDGFARRDALDLNGAGQLRGLIDAGGFGSWDSVISAHIDTADDGYNNASVGVNHVFSHDNGSAGDGGSAPPLPSAKQQGLPMMAYTLLRGGPAIVYHNARGISRSSGFFPREGSPNALGLDPATGRPDDTLTTLVRIRNEYGRGEFHPYSQGKDDVLAFQRATDTGNGYSANLLVAVCDRYDDGAQQRTVPVWFPPGTRLHELTGNAADPAVDPQNQVPEVVVVSGGGTVGLLVPHNRSGAVEHGRGYLVYGPVAPAGELGLLGADGVIGADPPNAPAYRRRLAETPVVTGDWFTVRLTTTQADPLDPNTDDSAVFRFNQGFADLNRDGAADFGEGLGPVSGYENFLTLNQPLYGSGAEEGRYAQEIRTADLPEGYNYLSVLAFRHRTAGEAPIFREFRLAVYLDRAGPEIELTDPGEIDASAWEFKIRPLDRTAQRVHFFWDLPPDVDPIPLISPFNQGAKRDRFDWRWTQADITHGAHTLTVVPVEVTGSAAVRRYEVFAHLCRVDMNEDGAADTLDFIEYLGLWAARDPEADFSGDGAVNTLDFVAFLNAWVAGC